MTVIANDNFIGENWKYLLAALAMHAVLVAALTVTFNTTRQPEFASQLAIKAVVIDNTAKRLKREKEQAEAERAAREKAEADEKAREQLAEEKKREQEAEVTRQKVAAEEKRKADAQQVTLRKQADEKKRADAIKAQQASKQKADREAREAALLTEQREREMAEEDAQRAVESSSMSSAYYASIVQRIESKWTKPPTATRGLECFITLTQAPGGLVVSMEFGKCNGDKAVRESLQTAVYNATPLPAPPDARLFKRQITFLFKPSN
jgi:colicin import membrane protein